MTISIPTLSEVWSRIAPKKAAVSELTLEQKIQIAKNQKPSPAQIIRGQELAFAHGLLTQPAPQGATMSFLSAIGKDIEKVFSFLGSPKGQSIITTGEGVATAIDPALSGVFTIANNWLTEILKLQVIGSAAGDTPGSDATKAAAVLNTLTPQVLAWAAANKATVPDATKIQAMNDALVAFLDAFGAPGSATTTTATTTTPATPAA